MEALATDKSAFACLDGYLTGVATSGTFIKSKELDVFNYNYNGVFWADIVPPNWI